MTGKRQILGAVLAGGQSRRFGSDKALAKLGGSTLLEQAIAALHGRCADVVVVGRDNAPVATIPDRPGPGMGPLAGVAAALHHARARGFDAVLTCPVDGAGLAADLCEALAPEPAYCESQPVIGLWPVSAGGAADAILAGPQPHSMRRLAEAIGARPVRFAVPPHNINTPADLADAERKHADEPAFERRGLHEVFAAGGRRRVDRSIAVEAPVAIEINGIGYAVMMATPADLDDYALGFCLAEQLIAGPGEFESAEAWPVGGGGWMLRIRLHADNAAPLLERARLRLSEGSCGLCGIESLEQVLRPLPPVTARLDIAGAAVFRALNDLPAQQVLGQATRAVHAAAFCLPSGEIVEVREDVGRHNAFDKLVGALARQGRRTDEGFALLTARCSFELVQKAIVAGFPVLAAISAPTTLALDLAAQAGLRLISLARPDSYVEF